MIIIIIIYLFLAIMGLEMGLNGALVHQEASSTTSSGLWAPLEKLFSHRVVSSAS